MNFNSKQRTAVVNFIGTYECKIDAKGRFLMPVAFKKQMKEQAKELLVLKRSVFQPCIEFYTIDEWEKLMNKVQKLNRFRKKNNDFIRLFTAGVKTVELDAQGRILIPKDLIDFAGISKQLVLASAISNIEIWDKAAYEQAVNSAITDFADLAEDVMGDQNDEDDVS
ncbi:MAG: division/cell wall cluster transcriptional repressor MraZ [Flavobacteriaceae bacterium]|nr:division/cell wall cluster transcriptional repressor MraZ [Flavobacteriaceae bacterium]